MQLLFFPRRSPFFFVALYSLDFIIDVQSIFTQSFTLVCKEQLTRCRPSFANVFFLCCRIKLNIKLLFCPRTPVLSVIVLEFKTGVLAGSFLPSGRLEMSEMSEVSEELRVYAVRERKYWTETDILDDNGRPERSRRLCPRQSPPIIFCLRQTRRKIPDTGGQPSKLGSAITTYLSR